MNIYLAGFMGAGKTTVGRILASRLNRPFVDLDDEIARAEGMPIAEIFRTAGEARFRDAETHRLEEVARTSGQVVALGGGALESESNRNILSRSGIVIWLQVSFPRVLERIAHDGSRPMFHNEEQLARLFEARLAMYELARVHVDTDDCTPEDVTEEVIAVGIR